MLLFNESYPGQNTDGITSLSLSNKWSRFLTEHLIYLTESLDKFTIWDRFEI